MRLNRYHIDVYIPDWSYNSMLEFCDYMSRIKLVPSFHAKKKLSRMKGKYRSAVKKIIYNPKLFSANNLDYVFEFCATDTNKIKKLCYRIPLLGFDTDVIVVVSSTGKVVTVYLNDNFDVHNKLHKDLYVKNPKDNEIGGSI